MLFTAFVGLLLAFLGALIGQVIDPESLAYLGVFIVLALLLSLTDRERFGWIEPRDGERERSVRG